MSRFHSRSGHTLVEILLALGLSLVILAAAYAALDQHWRFADAGQRQTERTQVVRALFERMSLDLRSVVFRAGVGSDLAIGTGDQTRIDVAARAKRYVGRSIGIVGDGKRLVLRIDTPAVERRAVERRAVEKPTGVQTIRWEMHRGAEATTGQGTFGLARFAGREAILDDVKSVSPSELLAAEVETLRFRYFARGNWVDHWDSVERQELPSAVEIVIGFRQAAATHHANSNQADAGEYRLLVPVPASEG